MSDVEGRGSSAHEQHDEALLARFLQHAEDGLRRINIEIASEQVTLYTRDGRLRELCTCGRSDGNGRCEHIAVVLRFLAEGAAQASPAEVRVRSSARPPPPDQDALSLATAFEELCVACARAGIEARDSPSIKQALEQLLAAAPDPVPLSLARWIGRFRDALSFGELGEASRLLDGALRFADELRDGGSYAWLDDREGEALSEVTLVEVAREWITGLDRASIERRYLIELVSGQVYSEERRRDEGAISVGPCPRLAQVAFAEVDSATRPPRAKLLQYSLSLQVPEAPWQRVVSLAQTELAVLREQFAAELRISPALAEPFAIFAPAQVEIAANALADSQGERLALRSDPNLSGIDALLAATRGADIVCVLGRMLGRASGLLMKPLSAVVRNGDWLELRRVT